MSQKLCRRLGALERTNAAALDAMHNRDRITEAQAGVEELKRQIQAWRITNSGPEHTNESLMETFARFLGISSGELRNRLMERAYGGSATR